MEIGEIEADFYVPQPPYHEIGEYPVRHGSKTYPIAILVSSDLVPAWMSGNGQTVNHLSRDNDPNRPLRIEEVDAQAVARMLQQLISVKSKIRVPLEVISREHGPLIQAMATDFVTASTR